MHANIIHCIFSVQRHHTLTYYTFSVIQVAIHNIVYMLYADWSFRLSVPAEQLILSVGFRDGSESTKVDINSFISELTKLIRLE